MDFKPKLTYYLLMLARISEQNEIDRYLKHALMDLSKANALRLKAGLRILMTTDQTTFETICSTSVQKDLQDFVSVLQHPEALAPKTCTVEEGRKAVIESIKRFTLSHLNLIDARTTLLFDSDVTTQTLTEGAHLKSIIHTSALSNVMNAAHFADVIEQRFKQQGLKGATLEEAVRNATIATAELHHFVIHGDILAVERNLKIPGVDVNHPNPDGLPLLHVATREGHVQIVKLLLKEPSVHVNLVNNTGWTPLHLAARLGYIEIVELLLQAPGINVNIVNSDGWTPLHWAAWHGHTEIVSRFLAAPGILVNPRDKTKNTPLHWAARNGQADVISLLASFPGIDLNPLDIDLKTPLYYAVMFDHAAAISILLEANGIDVNIQDIDGLTALHWAARNGKLELVNLLMEVPGIRTDLVDHNEMTPADWARRNGYDELLPYLGATQHALPWWKRFWQESLDYLKSRLAT